MTRLAGKVIIVTGAGGGLGRAMSRRFAAEGARVVATDKDPVAGGETAASIPDCLFMQHDVSDEERWCEVVAQVTSQFGGLHALVNNAGAVRLGTIYETTLDDLRFHERVILEGAFLGCKHAMPAIAASGGGSIVNITALAAFRGSMLLPAYAAVKDALHGLTRSLSAHCFNEKLNINVNALAPGVFDTAMNRQGAERVGDDPTIADIISSSVDKPENFAGVAAFFCSDDAKSINGQVLIVDNGVGTR